MRSRSAILLISSLVLLSSTCVAHDAWLSARWNKDKSRILVSTNVAEHFPEGAPIKGMDRFINPRAYIPRQAPIPLSGDTSDSTLMGALPVSRTSIVTTGVKQREVKFNRDLGERILLEEVGLTKEEAAKLLTPGIEEFRQTYSRQLKTIISTGKSETRDSVLGLSLEIVLSSWQESGAGLTTIQFRLYKERVPIANAPVRVLSDGKSTIVRTNEKGEAESTVNAAHPVLLSHINVSKESDTLLNSLWTNLAIYRLMK